MFKKLALTNVGPVDSLELDFAPRLNIFTGDNGLGKSFVLDVVWQSLTRKWPAEINPGLLTNLKALPRIVGKSASITFQADGKTKNDHTYTSNFNAKTQSWSNPKGRPLNPGLVIYAMADGGFAVWDPMQNYWKTSKSADEPADAPPAYVFTPRQVWRGLEYDGKTYCKGLLIDWWGWQKENGETFATLREVLKELSSEDETLEPGELRRMEITSDLEVPTLKTAYGEVFAPLASTAVRRVLSIAYILIWAWKGHREVCRLTGEKPTTQATFLFDEIEAHLHPKWQRKIVASLLKVLEKLAESDAHIQFLATTHSPLVLASLESLFDEKRDAWFDVDLQRDAAGKGRVVFEKEIFEKMGNASNWLQSRAFDLKYPASLEAEKIIEEALAVTDATPRSEVERVDRKLYQVLGAADAFLVRWRILCDKKGWLKK